MAAAAGAGIQLVGNCKVTLANLVYGRGTRSVLKHSHAMLIVEGVTAIGQNFVGYYEVGGLQRDTSTYSKQWQHFIGNTQGTVGITVTEGIALGYRYESRKTWDVTAQNVHAMIDPLRLLHNTRIPYQTAGNMRSSLIGGNGAHNCITWAKEQLERAGIDTGVFFTDLIKTIPKVHTDPTTQTAIYGLTAAVLGAVSIALWKSGTK